MIEVIHKKSAWDDRAGNLFADDVYYQWEFLETWAREERAEPTGFYFEQKETRIFYPFLKLSLEALPGGEGWFDVRTPYDFGGPRIVGPADEAALARFDQEWRQYCASAQIVTEFGRLHPLASIARTGDVSHYADNYVVDLRLSEEELGHRQHKNHRWAVRRALRNELEFLIDERPSDADRIAWKEMYAATMRRVNAGATYDFSSVLFDALFRLPGVYLATVTAGTERISQAIFVSSGQSLFYYLSASTDAGRTMKAANFMLDQVIEFARSRGHRCLHLGGGPPSLRHFKKQISTGTVPYFVARTVHDLQRYERLAGAAPPGAEEFPVYRSRVVGARLG